MQLHSADCKRIVVIILDNFQDQMKRELAYREEMVQHLQMVRR